MLASRCAKCGKYFIGWSLSIPESHKCPHCGSQLAIHDDTVCHEVDWDAILQSMDTHQDAGQYLIEKTVGIHLNGRLPNFTSAN